MDNTVLHYKNIVYFLKRRCLRNINDNCNFVLMYGLSLHKIINFIFAKLYVIVKICFFSINFFIVLICFIAIFQNYFCNLKVFMQFIECEKKRNVIFIALFYQNIKKYDLGTEAIEEN